MLQASGHKLYEGTNQVILKGAAHGGYAFQPDGLWRQTGETLWYTLGKGYRAQAIIDNLDALKSWGGNCFRLQIPLCYWIDNTSSFQANFIALCSLAAARGMYIIICPAFVRNNAYPCGGDKLPYGAWLTGGAGDLAYMPNRAAFVSFWADVADKMKAVDNILFEIWNEPHGAVTGIDMGSGDTATRDEFFTMSQQVVTAIRTALAYQPILMNWGYGGFYDTVTETALYHLSNFNTYKPTDTQNNLVLAPHFYSTFLTDGSWTRAQPSWANILEWSAGCGLDDAAALYPIVFTEVGSNTSPDYTYQSPWYDQPYWVLRRLDELVCGFTGWGWTTKQEMLACPMLQGALWNFTPNPLGHVIKRWLL